MTRNTGVCWHCQDEMERHSGMKAVPPSSVVSCSFHCCSTTGSLCLCKDSREGAEAKGKDWTNSGRSASICLGNLLLKSAAQAASPDPVQPDASLPKMTSRHYMGDSEQISSLAISPEADSHVYRALGKCPRATQSQVRLWSVPILHAVTLCPLTPNSFLRQLLGLL